MPIFSKLREKTDNYQNFAYICKFDQNQRKNGREFLYLSNSEPLEVFDSSSLDGDFLTDFLLRKNEDCSDSIKFGVPLYVGYDYVKTVYPDIEIARSSWPVLSLLLPEKLEHGTVRREDNLRRERKTGNFSDDKTEEKISDLIKRVYLGELLQIVLSRRFEIGSFDPFETVRYFIENDRSLYVFYYRFGDYEIIGSSPENLVSLENRILMIKPIAGTRRRGNSDLEEMTLESDLMTDQKELKEHRMLVDLARNDLAKVSLPGSVQVTKSMEVQKFATVQHLVSSVTSRVGSELTLDGILRAVFPAGTVSGAPKKRAIQLIDKFEEFPRGPYGGAIGIAGQDYMDLALLIRSIFSHRGQSYTQAGAGIVKDSVPANEIQEIYSKTMTVIGGLGNESVSYR